jgi:hypothetical protein
LQLFNLFLFCSILFILSILRNQSQIPCHRYYHPVSHISFLTDSSTPNCILSTNPVVPSGPTR